VVAPRPTNARLALTVRVVFLGSQEIGARCLEVVLRAGHDVVGVGTFEPGGHERWTDDVARIALERGLPRIRGRRFRTPAAVEELRALAPDILLAVGWRWILPEEVLAVPPRGCLGIHGSLLPRLRGFAPVNWALIRDERETGPTLFYFDRGTDTGDIVGQQPFVITDDDDAATVRARLADAAVELLAEHLPGLAAGTAPRTPQNESGASYGARRTPEDGAIDWRGEPRTVFNWVRGLTRPYPGAFGEIAGRRVVVWKVRPLPGPGPGPGRFDGTAGRPVVGAGSGAVEVVEAALLGDESHGAMQHVAEELRRAGGFDPLPGTS
jgi:methionyl-tRNA formyltransferase